MPNALATLTLAACLLAQPLAALNGTRHLPTDPAPAYISVDAKVDAFASQLQSYVDYCRDTAEAAYAVDCLSERMTFAARSLGGYGWERGVKATLLATARSLDAVVATYGDPDAGAIVLQGRGANPITSGRKLRPIAAANIPRATAAALAVITEAELTLLRSSGTSDANALAFAQVAQVVGTAKVLLRAA